MPYYTGVGSRKTPENIKDMMTLIARLLEQRGYVLRSGGAKGADQAFEAGIMNQNNKQIYFAEQASPEAMNIAAQFHPVWHKCNPYARKLHGRNAFQVLGFDLNPEEKSEFLICWTPDGCTQHIGRSFATGGTGTAISIAEHYGTRIVNLKRPDHHQKTVEWLQKQALRQ